MSVCACLGRGACPDQPLRRAAKRPCPLAPYHPAEDGGAEEVDGEGEGSGEGKGWDMRDEEVRDVRED